MAEGERVGDEKAEQRDGSDSDCVEERDMLWRWRNRDEQEDKWGCDEREENTEEQCRGH
jgi:hypothetical protein